MSTKSMFFPRLAFGAAVMISAITLAGCALQPQTQADRSAGTLAKAKADAEAGDPAAQYYYGVYLLREKQDYVAAHSWFLKSAQGGNRDGQEILAGDYLTGRGVAPDLTLAVSWMQKSADQGSPIAQYQLAQMYGRGYGVPKNQAKQIALLEKAARQQDTDAINALTQLGDPHGVARQASAQKAAANQTAAEGFRNLQMQEAAEQQAAEQRAAQQQNSQSGQQQMCSVNNGQVTYLRPC
jgi:hypothetical protein